MSTQYPWFFQQMSVEQASQGMAWPATSNLKPFPGVLQQPSFLVPITPYICSPLGVFAFNPQMAGGVMPVGQMPGQTSVAGPIMLPGGAQRVESLDQMASNQLAPMIQQTAPTLMPAPGSRDKDYKARRAAPLEPAVSPSMDSSRTAKESLMPRPPVQAQEPISPPESQCSNAGVSGPGSASSDSSIAGRVGPRAPVSRIPAPVAPINPQPGVVIGPPLRPEITVPKLAAPIVPPFAAKADEQDAQPAQPAQDAQPAHPDALLDAPLDQPLSEAHAQVQAQARAHARLQALARKHSQLEADAAAPETPYTLLKKYPRSPQAQKPHRAPGRPPTEKVKVVESEVSGNLSPIQLNDGYQCAFCDKFMKSRQHCRRHMRTHFDSKSHACNRCSKKFHRKDTRDRHQFSCKKR